MARSKRGCNPCDFYGNAAVPQDLSFPIGQKKDKVREPDLEPCIESHCDDFFHDKIRTERRCPNFQVCRDISPPRENQPYGISATRITFSNRFENISIPL